MLIYCCITVQRSHKTGFNQLKYIDVNLTTAFDDLQSKKRKLIHISTCDFIKKFIFVI